jgi:diguanylate cyclase (GGDEF)-like protein
MDIINFRPEFVIYVIEADGGVKNAISDALASARFQVESFSSAEGALQRIKISPPHIIFGATSIDFIENVRGLSSDIEFVFLTRSGNKKDGLEALRRGAFSFLEKPFSNLAEVVSAADRITEVIYLRMENEQLLEQHANPSGTATQLFDFTQKLSRLTELDQIIQALLEEISRVTKNVPVIFLKFLPAYQSLAVTNSVKIPAESVRNVGIKLDRYGPRNISNILQEPLKFTEIKELMSEIFKCSEFDAVPFSFGGSPVGLIVTFNKGENIAKLLTSIGELAYNNASLNSKLHDLSLRDSLTGLFNRKYFNEKVEEEMNRSRRTHYPLSIIYLEIDHFQNYSDANGFSMGDIILKSVSQIFLRTSRKIDITARLSNEAFIILCPNTPGVGAAVKAEKIRLTIEQTKFPNGEKQPLGKITVSIGVSEYPGVVNTSDLLLRTAADALFQVKEGGRNRVCLAEPAHGFKRDFDALPVPGFQTFPETRSQQSI